ncbi:MAG TPA: hypothetical protein VEK38_01495, partial [Candidatus Bathyarchaeia archaeon]|nr:hypothetical protein [Candidatus Bathyarchaeia archaeon]
QYQNKIISVRTKADMQQEFSENNMALHAVSICDLDSIVTLHAIIARKVKELFENADVPFLLNARHYHLLSTVSQILAQVYELFEKKPIAYELIAYHLNDALAHLAHMSGKTVGEKVMDTVFQTFCVGK